MIIARFDGIAVEITDAVNRMAYIPTLNGSKPFTAWVARGDSEETPYPGIVEVDWKVVDADQLIDIQQCSHDNVILDVTGGWYFDVAPYDNIKESLTCLDCQNEIRIEQSEPNHLTETEF